MEFNNNLKGQRKNLKILSYYYVLYLRSAVSKRMRNLQKTVN